MKKWIGLGLLFLLLLAGAAMAQEAEDITAQAKVKASSLDKRFKTYAMECALDRDYTTQWRSKKERRANLEITSQEPVYGIYFCSGMEAPEPWVVEVPDGKSWTVAARADGVYGHEYLALEGLTHFRIRLETTALKVLVAPSGIFCSGMVTVGSAYLCFASKTSAHADEPHSTITGIFPQASLGAAEKIVNEERILEDKVKEAEYQIQKRQADIAKASNARTIGWIFCWTIIGLVIALFWLFIYRTPPQEVLDRTVNADLKTPAGEQKSFTFKQLFKTHTLWGGILIRLVSDPVWYFCCFWLPGFLRSMGAHQGLTNEQTLNMIQWIGGIPFLVGAIGGILTSAWSDGMIRRGMPALKARKKMLISVVVIAPLCMLVPFINAADMAFGLKIGLIIAIFSLVAVLCLSWLYTIPVVFAETFPVKNIASVMGLSCGAGALGSMVFNQFVGSIPESGWKILFIIMGTLHLFAALILWKLVRKENPDNA